MIMQAPFDNIRGKYAVDVQAEAEKRGLKVFSAALPEGVSGMIVRDESFGTASGFIIKTDKSESAVRQRFTAAHEIGHYELHKHLIGNGVSDNYLLRSANLSTRVEVEANKFAADLLMPYDQIDKAMADGIRSPKALAAAFNVSEIAMAIRLGMPT